MGETLQDSVWDGEWDSADWRCVHAGCLQPGAILWPQRYRYFL